MQPFTRIYFLRGRPCAQPSVDARAVFPNVSEWVPFELPVFTETTLPPGYPGTAEGWAELRGHMAAWAHHLSDQEGPLAVLYEKAQFVADASAVACRFFKDLPTDWEALGLDSSVPVGGVRITDNVFRHPALGSVWAYALKRRTAADLHLHVCNAISLRRWTVAADATLSFLMSTYLRTSGTTLYVPSAPLLLP